MEPAVRASSARLRVLTRCAGALAALAACCSAAVAKATIESAAFYDSRAQAMGATAVANTPNGAALYYNVAQLTEIEHAAVTGDLLGLTTVQTAPANGDGTSVRGKAELVPLFLLGGGLRLNDSLVVGAAAYAVGGFGGSFPLTGLGVSDVQLGAIEITPGAAYALTDSLSIGVGYRITHVSEHAESNTLAPPPFPAGRVLSTVTDVSGTSYAGLHVGVLYRPTSLIKLGFSYRSKTTTDLSGTTHSGALALDTTSDFSFPHTFRVGGAVAFPELRMDVAFDVRYQMYSDSNRTTVVKTSLSTTTQVLDWKDAWSAGGGVEYFVLEDVALRGGYVLTTSATPGDRPAPFYPTPGLLHSLNAGVGVRLGPVDVDASAFYAWAGYDARSVLPQPDQPGSGPYTGHYGMKVYSASVSSTVRF